MTPQAPPPKLAVRRVLETDVDQLMTIQFSAFENDPYHEALFPGPHASPLVRKRAGERTLEDWRNTPAQEIIVCANAQTGEILGFASWNFYLTERPREEWEKMPEITWTESEEEGKRAGAFLGATARMRMKIWEGRPHILCGLLCVHREAQRQGVGAALVQWGLDRCIEERLPAYLEASTTGYPLYLKLGFSKIDTMIVKAEDWGGDRDLQYNVMRNDEGVDRSVSS